MRHNRRRSAASGRGTTLPLHTRELRDTNANSVGFAIANNYADTDANTGYTNSNSDSIAKRDGIAKRDSFTWMQPELRLHGLEWSDRAGDG